MFKLFDLVCRLALLDGGVDALGAGCGRHKTGQNEDKNENESETKINFHFRSIFSFRLI